MIVLSNSKRLQVMKSLSVLKFMGCYDNWKIIKDRYQLKWSNENSIETSKKLTMKIMVSIYYATTFKKL